MMLVRGGLVLQPGGERFAPADLVIDGETIADIVAPGSVSGEGRQVVDAQDRLVIPGLVNGHNHAQANLGKGLADRWTLETAAQSRALDGRAAHARGEVPLGRHRRLRDAAQGLHRQLRHVRRVPAAHRRGRERGGAGLCGRRRSRRHRADDGRPQLLRGHPGPGRCAAGRLARTGAGDPLRAARAKPVGVSVDPGTVALRPPACAAGARAHHPAPLQRRVPVRLPRPRARTRPGPADARGRIEGAGRRGTSSATASRSSRIWTIWACCSRAFASPTASGWTTTTVRDWRTMAPRSRTTRAAT